MTSYYYLCDVDPDFGEQLLDEYEKALGFQPVLKHIVGNVNPLQYKNLYFVGNTGGFIDSFIGIGGHRAIMSGVTAARSIANNLDYNKLIMPIIKDIWKKYELRKTINFFTDRSFDRLITFLKLPIIKQLVFKNPLYKTTMIIPFVKLYNRIKLNKWTNSIE